MNLGLGVMINMLSSNEETINSIKSSIGKEIQDISIVENELKIDLPDFTLIIWDNGQSCCEHRYMKTDDDLNSFIGEEIIGFELKNSNKTGDEDYPHEIQFIEIKTNKSVISFSNHNEHNGFYGGFSISAKII